MPAARERLLEAATVLFGERSYDRTTTRDLADAAGVDAALIARYFGSKAGLYLATLRLEVGDLAPPDLLQPERMRALLERVALRGPGPVFQSAVSPHPDEAVQTGAREALQERLVAPLTTRFATAGLDRAALRAELVAAAFAGIALGRASGAFPQLTALDEDELVALVTELLG